MHLFVRYLIAAAAFLSLMGCTIQNPALDTLMYVLPSHRQYAEVQPNVEYLRVELDGRAALMALGSRQVEGIYPHVRVTERWYNAKGEMLVLQDGRIFEVLGMAQEWRHQQSKPPSWQEIGESEFLVEWQRTLDLMPGYRYGQLDEIVSGKIAPVALPNQDIPTDVQWFGDIVLRHAGLGQTSSFTQKFALKNGRVVYSEQCVVESLCFKLKPLGVVVAK